MELSLSRMSTLLLSPLLTVLYIHLDDIETIEYKLKICLTRVKKRKSSYIL